MNTLESLPRHVAIIMDGNGRWAKQKGKPRAFGHKAGVENVRSAIRTCLELGIEGLTVFAFSTENWNRPKKEVGILMDLFLSSLTKEVAELNNNGVRIKFIGDCSAFSKKLQKQISDSEQLTKDNKKLAFNIAANYGGRWDIMNAAKNICRRIENGELSTDQFNIELLHSETALGDLPEPDLFIRTGGEHRISNFLLWQLAYTELYFTDVFWPDFDRTCFEEALNSFSTRQRRFGHTGEQIEKVSG
ncbi:MAG: polyprenyl diphosphate synthase [Gammaproteobacteria bacterium]|nr:polyprenyl diphosphate synthase [Gammaproteobacteria bacterium]